MTELESHLTEALQRLEAQYRQRDQMLAATLIDLSARLDASAAQQKSLSSQVHDLAGRVERLTATMKLL